MSQDVPFAMIETAQDLSSFIELLREAPWLRATQLVGSMRRDDAGDTQGYDAQLIFQADNLASQPLELRLEGVVKLELSGAGLASAEDATGSLGELGFRLVMQGLQVAASRGAYRAFPGQSSGAGPATH